MKTEDVGDGYVRFLDAGGVVIGEVYALTQKDMWRSRVNNEDKDFDSKEKAMDDAQSRINESA